MNCSLLSLCPVLAQWALCQILYICHCDGRVNMDIHPRHMKGAFTTQGHENLACVHECVIHEQKERKGGLS